MARIRQTSRNLVLFALGLVLAGCGDHSLVGPDPLLDPLVGQWDAISMDADNPLQPGTVVDLLDGGVSFFLNIQPSGFYTAILSSEGSAGTEIGRLKVDGSELVFTTEFPTIDTYRAQWTLLDGILSLDGDTEIPLDETVTVTTRVVIKLAQR